MNIFNGKIVIGVDYEGKSHDCRVVDKLIFRGDEMYLCVKIDGATFLTNNIQKLHNKEDSLKLWNEFFSLLFNDSAVGII